MDANSFQQGEIKEQTVRLRDLTKRFGEVVAVDRVHLDAKRGEFLTLLGPGGSGKTTVLLMIAGFQIPNSGQIYVKDEMIVLNKSYYINRIFLFPIPARERGG